MLCTRCKKRPAAIFITRMEGDKSSNEGLCLICAKELGIKPVEDILKKFGISDDELESFANQMGNFLPQEEDGFEQGGTPTFPNFAEFFSGMQEGAPSTEKNTKNDNKNSSDGSKQKKYKYLSTYCEDLTQKAIDGKIDNVIGRNDEIYRTIQILCRRQKNNPCLIGEAGVGKTAIAEGVALRISQGNVPNRLKDKRVFLLDLTALVAGTQFRGQFESRVKGLINEVVQDQNIILFIDEVHNLTGAGDADGAMSASNILKPALSRGEIQVIGATTFAEYRKYIEKDQALERRFQPVKVEEPSIADTISILNGIKGYYEDYHKVKVSEELIKDIVNLSERYISDRYLPDKAIDLLDESCACASLASAALAQYQENIVQLVNLKNQESEESSKENPDYEKVANLKSEILKLEEQTEVLKQQVNDLAVTHEDVAKVIELWTGIPAASVAKDEFERLRTLEDQLKKSIIGQDEAVSKVAKAIRRTRVSLAKTLRPASFIFVGPTGVGKTELAKSLGRELFDKVDPIIRIDMSEYMEKHTVSRLIGSPPGYVGYDEAGQLTEKVRRKPYSVVLFDEIEKAHPDVMNILLQILDEGRITDAQGRTVNFEHTVVIMTSNAGSNAKNNLAGFGQSLEQQSNEQMMNALRDFLRPEFLSRVDEIVVFNPLSFENLVQITDLLINEIRQPLQERGISLNISDAVKQRIVEYADNGRYGARDLRHIIRRELEDSIAEVLIDDEKLSTIKEITFDCIDGTIQRIE